jgi:hypothetical protein
MLEPSHGSRNRNLFNSGPLIVEARGTGVTERGMLLGIALQAAASLPARAAFGLRQGF